MTLSAQKGRMSGNKIFRGQITRAVRYQFCSSAHLGVCQGGFFNFKNKGAYDEKL